MTASTAQDERPSPQKQPVEPTFVTVSGQTFRVAFRPGTDGRPALLICNGIGANFEVLSPLVEAMPERTIILFDAPGTGGSPAPILPFRFSTLVRRIVGLLDALGQTEAVDLMGVSWGGALAQTLAFQYPNRFRRLILAATSSGSTMVPGAPDVLMKMTSGRRYSNADFMRRNAGALYGGRFRDDPAHAEQHGRAMSAPNWLGYTYQLLAMVGWTSLPWLWLLKQPTLVMHGSDDPIAPLINARVLATLIPRAKLVVLDDGHLFMLTDPAGTAATVTEFLDETK